MNKGKGRALKTAFAHYLDHCAHLDGVVTADADGQHSVEDISRIAYALNHNRDKLVLGVRDFAKENVPKRSYMGNTITTWGFKLLYGYYLKDTQTGLRGIPTTELAWMIELSGERYEFEINMLIKARRRKLDFLEINIETIYFDNNAGSHYGSFKDSARIFGKLLGGLMQYSLSCSFCAVVDVGVFILLNSFLLTDMPLAERLLWATIIARTVSSLFNFIINAQIVFVNNKRIFASAIKYYTLWAMQMISSYALVYAGTMYLGLGDSLCKVFVDIGLAVISYQIQMNWVFSGKKGLAGI